MRSVYTHNLAKVTLTAKARTATEDGTAVDRLVSGEQFRSSMLVVNVGTVTDGTHAYKIMYSDDNSNWNNCDSAYLQGSAISVTSASDEVVYELGYTGPGRYLRCTLTVTGSPSTGGVSSATIVSSGHSTPVR
jgi:hypothetical protein